MWYHMLMYTFSRCSYGSFKTFILQPNEFSSMVVDLKPKGLWWSKVQWITRKEFEKGDQYWEELWISTILEYSLQGSRPAILSRAGWGDEVDSERKPKKLCFMVVALALLPTSWRRNDSQRGVISNIKNSEAKFINEEHDIILSSFVTFFWPRRGRVGVRSPGGALYWRHMAEMDGFVSNKDASSSAVAISVPMWKRDPSGRNKSWWGAQYGSDSPRACRSRGD